MTRSATIGLIACLAGAAVIGIAYSLPDGRFTLALLAAIALVTLGSAHLVARRRGRVGGLLSQSRIAIAMVVGSVLLAVWVGAAFMFVSEHDAVVVSVMTAAIGLIAVRVGEVLSRGAITDARRIRDGLERVGRGERELLVPVEGGDELAEVAAAAEAMTSRLASAERRRAEIDAARRGLVAAVSHDLRTPLSSLRLLVDAISDGVVTGETRDAYLKRVRVHVELLSDLVDDLFELSRIEAGDVTWSMDRIELGPLVGDTVEAMLAQAETRGVRVATELDGHELVAIANPEKVQRVLFNLIQNAIRHTPPDGSVMVRARPGVGEVEVEVSDEGEGIRDEDRERIFDPFYRGASAGETPEGAGPEAGRGGAPGAATDLDEEGPGGGLATDDGRAAGLGLAISRAIVEAHGGRIWLEPAAGGTRMCFTLPAGPSQG